MDGWRCILGYILAKVKKEFLEGLPWAAVSMLATAVVILIWRGIKLLAEWLGIDFKIVILALFSIALIFAAGYNLIEMIREAKERCK